MKKEELKGLILESVNEIKEEQNAYKILREGFEQDVNRLHEHRVLCESLVQKGLLTEQEIDEGFFDTLKHFGKNTVNSVVNAWKKAKAQGDEDAIARLEKKIAKIKAAGASGKSGGEKGKRSVGGGRASKTKSSGGERGETVSEPSNKKASREKSRAAALSVAGDAILSRTDPTTAKKIKKAGPKAVEKAIKNPKIKKKAAEIAKEVSKEKGEGLLSKLGSWLKKNPVKGALAIAAIAAVTTAVTGGAAGPAAAATVAGMLKGGAIGGGVAGTLRGAGALAKGQGLKAAGKEALKGFGQGFVGGAAGNLVGKALGGATGLFGGDDVNPRQMSRDADDFDLNADKPSYTGGGIEDDNSTPRAPEDDFEGDPSRSDFNPLEPGDPGYIDPNAENPMGLGKQPEFMKGATPFDASAVKAPAAAPSGDDYASKYAATDAASAEDAEGVDMSTNPPPTAADGGGTDTAAGNTPAAAATAAKTPEPELSPDEAKSKLRDYYKTQGFDDDMAGKMAGIDNTSSATAPEATPTTAAQQATGDEEDNTLDKKGHLRYQDQTGNYSTPGKGRVDTRAVRTEQSEPLFVTDSRNPNILKLKR